MTHPSCRSIPTCSRSFSRWETCSTTFYTKAAAAGVFFLRWLQRSVKGWSGRLASGQLGLETRFKLFFFGLVVCLFAAISRPSFVCLAGEPAVAGSNVTCSGVYLSSQRLNFRMLGFRLVLLATLGRSYPHSTLSQFWASHIWCQLEGSHQCTLEGLALWDAHLALDQPRPWTFQPPRKGVWSSWCTKRGRWNGSNVPMYCIWAFYRAFPVI